MDMKQETRGRDNIRPIFSRLRKCQDRPECPFHDQKNVTG